MKNKSVVLIEIAGSHDECIYSQCQIFSYLGYDIHIIASENMNSRFNDYKMLRSLNFFDIPHKRIDYLPSLLKIRKLIRQITPDLIIFNTCSNNLVLELLILLGKRFNYAGIIHGVEKLSNSNSQKLISWYVKKYFVLNDYILNHIPNNYPRNQLSSLYTIYSPYNFLKQNIDDTFRICIPGNFEYRRRDYLFLLNLSSNKLLDKRVKFVILGNAKHKNSSSADFISQASELGVMNRFVFFDEFTPPQKFAEITSSSDLLMPLIHPMVPDFKSYLKTKISGTFNLSFTYKIPMLILDDFAVNEDFGYSSFFYNFDNIIDLINLLAKNPDLIKDKIQSIENLSKFSLENQVNKIRQFLSL